MKIQGRWPAVPECAANNIGPPNLLLSIIDTSLDVSSRCFTSASALRIWLCPSSYPRVCESLVFFYLILLFFVSHLACPHFVFISNACRLFSPIYAIYYVRVPVLFLLLICYYKCINFNYKADLALTMNTLPVRPFCLFRPICSVLGTSSIENKWINDHLKTIWRTSCCL